MSHGIQRPAASANRIDYVEFSVRDVQVAKGFYVRAFGWTFEDYGEGYASFNCGNLTGGFAKAENVKRGSGAPLVVLYADDLAAAEKRVVDAGGRIVRPTFAFPGGKRFHFSDPSDNELAVWSDR